MAKTATVNIRVDEKLKTSVESVLSLLGTDITNATRMFYAQILLNRGIPFEVKSRVGAIELFDGNGSYICENGHVHDYSKLNLEDAGEKDGPFDSVEDLMRSLDD